MTAGELPNLMRSASCAERQILTELAQKNELETDLADGIAERIRKAAQVNEWAALINRGTPTELALGRELYDKQEWPLFRLLAERIEARK